MEHNKALEPTTMPGTDLTIARPTPASCPAQFWRQACEFQSTYPSL